MSITRPRFQGFGHRVGDEWVVVDGGLEFPVSHTWLLFEDVNDDRQTLLWRSVDGVEWTSTPLEGFENFGVIHLAFLDNQYFMTGVTGESSSAPWTTYRSTDLIEWEPVDRDLTLDVIDIFGWSWTDDLIMQGTHAVFSHDLSEVSDIDPFGEDKWFVAPVVATADRFYAVVGQRGRFSGQILGPWEIWSTSDGFDWQPDNLVLGSSGSEWPPTLAATRNQILVYEEGSRPGDTKSAGRGSLYLAESGGDFAEIPTPHDGHVAIMASDDYFAVVGAGANSEFGETQAIVYMSRDGQTWSQVLDDPRPAFVWAHPDRIVVGYSGGECASSLGGASSSCWWTSIGWLLGEITG
jgi:hypothetical protein